VPSARRKQAQRSRFGAQAGQAQPGEAWRAAAPFWNAHDRMDAHVIELLQELISGWQSQASRPSLPPPRR